MFSLIDDLRWELWFMEFIVHSAWERHGGCQDHSIRQDVVFDIPFNSENKWMLTVSARVQCFR